jgi:predicted esterase
MIERNIAASTHGRYLVSDGGSASAILAGFHGYAESAELEYSRLESIPGCERWLRVAVQALHPFYRGRSNEVVVASWMTTQNRELAIRDNCAYVASVVESLVNPQTDSPILVFNGFSQGVSMAFRAAVTSRIRTSGVIACGGDVPPELDVDSLSRIPFVLLGRGSSDEWYSEEKLASDERRLRAAGVAVQVLRFEGGHEWPPVFARAAGEFLNRFFAASGTGHP